MPRHNSTTSGWSVTRTASESKRPVNQRGVVGCAGKTNVTGPRPRRENGFPLCRRQHGIINIRLKLRVVRSDQNQSFFDRPLF